MERQQVININSMSIHPWAMSMSIQRQIDIDNFNVFLFGVEKVLKN